MLEKWYKSGFLHMLIGGVSVLIGWLRLQAQPAELVFRNAAVYTVDAARSWAEAVAIREGKIIFVGTGGDVDTVIGPHTRVLDLAGKMVLPGFHDLHVHLVSGGIELGECNLNACETVEQIFEVIRRYAAARPEASWIRGGGWQLPIFPGANPHKAQLDAVVADRPVYLTAADGHSAWVNSKALELAEITHDTPDPPNGRIERDPQTGEATGTLREEAMALVARLLPAYDEADYIEGLQRGLAMANRFGITSLQEASATEATVRAYQTLAQRGDLTARVSIALYVDPAKGMTQVLNLIALRNKYASDNPRIYTAKFFADGVIEARTAALLEPYLQTAHHYGTPNFSAGLLNGLVAAIDSAGMRVHVHAIGDSAIRMTLDAFEHALAVNGSRDARHQITHLQLFHPDDIPRFRRLGVMAVFQPLWAYADTYITELTEPFLGPERSRWLYPIGSLVKSGAIIAGASDWSVSSMNPLDAIQVAVTRTDYTRPGGKPWIAEERVDLPTMLAAYTINGAYGMFQEQETGSIEPGKAADLIILDRNLFEIPVAEIHHARVMLTLLEGREVYRDPAFVY